MKMCYADPPYPGTAKKHYGPGAQEVDHKTLITGLVENYEGWALSTGIVNLRAVLPLCPEGVRICAWTKPFNAMHSNVAPIYAWEPVIVKPARSGRKSPYFTKDYIECSPPIFRNKRCSAVHGEKPWEFCFWVFKILGARPDDEFVDLFPGSGVVGRAWNQFRAQQRLDG